MTRDFAAWFNRALLEVPDPVTGLPFTNPQIAERVGCSAEKIKTWRQGRTVPGTVEDVAAIAKLLHVSQADVLAAMGYDVHVDALVEDERQVLMLFRRLPPGLRDAVPRLIRALLPANGRIS